LAVLGLPTRELEDAVSRLEDDGEHTFTRLTDDDERREPWVFIVGDDGRAARIQVHSIFYERID
jgi:hypothetical protein